MDKLMPAVLKAYENANKKITTGSLNEIIQSAYSVSAPPSKNGKRLRMFLGSQTGTCPPEFTLFVNDSSLMTDNYLRYMENSIRKSIDFSGTPIKMVAKSKKEEDL